MRERDIELRDDMLEFDVMATMVLSSPDRDELGQALDILSPEDFTSEMLATTFKAVAALYDDDSKINLATVTTKCKELGLAWSADDFKRLAQGVTEGELLPNARLLAEYGRRRNIRNAVMDIAGDLLEGKSSAEGALDKLQAVMDGAQAQQADGVESYHEVYNRVMDVLNKKLAGEYPGGIYTGYSLIDNEGGLEAGALVVFAGRTSSGKTAFAVNNVAANVAANGNPVLIYSLEMSNDQVVIRQMARYSGVKSTDIKNATNMDAETYAKVSATNYDLPLYYEPVNKSPRQLLRSIKRLANKYKARVVVIDYAQFLLFQGELRVEMGNLANALKALAKEINVTIVLLSQLARQKSDDPQPRINELKESGSLENAADQVYMIYRPEQHGAEKRFPNMSHDWSKYSTKGTALLMCVKNRLGATGEQLLHFNADTLNFWDDGNYPAAESATDPIDDYCTY